MTLARLNAAILSPGTITRILYQLLGCNGEPNPNVPAPPIAALAASVACVAVSVTDNRINPCNPVDTLVPCFTVPDNRLLAPGANCTQTPFIPVFSVLVIVEPAASYPTAKFM